MTRQMLGLLLTDIEASTVAWGRHEPAMSTALDIVDRCIATLFADHDGEVVRARGEGDSHFVVFDLATAAVRAAAAIQRALAVATWPVEAAPLHVRAAVHVGEVHRRDDDFVGHAVNVAARLRAVAHGGQAVVSRAVVEVVGTSAVDDLTFESLGRHRVRDVPGWTEVFQLCGPGLRHDFPSLNTIDTGLPPITAIVILDVVDHRATVGALDPSEEPAAWATVTGAFADAFVGAAGQYLKHLGDGCLALFADPDAALGFAREARRTLAAQGLAVRSVINVGRITFVRDEPVGRALVQTADLVHRAAPDRITLTATAAALLGEADDTVGV